MKNFSKPKIIAKIFDTVLILFSIKVFLSEDCTTCHPNIDLSGPLALFIAVFLFINVIRYFATFNSLVSADRIFFILDIFAILSLVSYAAL